LVGNDELDRELSSGAPDDDGDTLTDPELEELSIPVVRVLNVALPRA
jgi:hypothetical protein